MVILSTSSSTHENNGLAELDIFEIEIQQPPTREDWISGIRNAVNSSSQGSDSDTEVFESLLRKNVESKHLKMRRLTANLKAKDLELAKLLDEKMNIMKDIVEVVSGEEKTLKDSTKMLDLSNIDYVKLVSSLTDGSSFTKEHLLATLQEATKLAGSLYSANANLSRSASSVGERHSHDFAVPLLPKRAETFSEFDQPIHAPKKLAVQEINLMSGETDEAEFVTGNQGFINSSATASVTIPETEPESEIHPGLPCQTSPLQSLDPEQQKTAYEMTHQLNRLMCMVSTHFTNIER